MKKIFVLLVLGILALTIYHKEVPLLTSVANLIKGKETISSVLSKIEPAVSQRLKQPLAKAGFTNYPKKLFLVAIKEAQTLEVYGQQGSEIKLIKIYPFTAFSGQLGPKLKEGDRQIPEGIYKIQHLNPNSSYHLSLKVNYPNQFDISKTVFSDKKKMGGDIFIHGKAVTIGCIPIGDLAIEEVFVLAQNAMAEEIPIIIAPRDFRKEKPYPKIDEIDWEVELYEQIEESLDQFSISE